MVESVILVKIVFVVFIVMVFQFIFAMVKNNSVVFFIFYVKIFYDVFSELNITGYDYVIMFFLSMANL